MITSDRQLKATQEKINYLRESLANEFPELPDEFRQGVINQRRELIQELEQEVAEYRQLKHATVEEIPIRSLRDLVLAPIRFRLAKGLTIEEFAELVGIHKRQIAKYEEEEYEKITIENLTKILSKLNPRISGGMPVNQRTSNDD